MFHPHIKKICALSFLFVGGIPVFAMEEEREVVRPFSTGPGVSSLRAERTEGDGNINLQDRPPITIYVQDSIIALNGTLRAVGSAETITNQRYGPIYPPHNSARSLEQTLKPEA